MSLTGGCQCGGVRYELTAAPERVSICHCRDCQRSSGAPMVVWVCLKAEDFRITKGEAARYNSSGDSYRHFCPRCSTGLCYINETFLPGLIDVQGATLDDPSACPPGAQVQTAEAERWIMHLHDLPSFARYPGMD